MKHVLTVDDNSADCILIFTLLSKMGFIVTICHTVMDAINSINVRKVDVLIIDLQMPEISGFDLIKNIRDKDQDIPIVVISAYNADFEKQKAFQLGASYYIVKPYTQKEVQTVFKQWL